MLYKKNNTKQLDLELFKNPTCEYRGTPFWAWNCKLDKETLTSQIEYLKEMGFGGFHIHSRAGMATEYLSDEFMDLINTCIKKAKSEDMLVWLYDEDRWPSGSAGGYVTKTKKFRKRFLYFTKNKDENAVDSQTGINEGLTYLFACYDIALNDKGELAEYKIIKDTENAVNTKWYAYIKTEKESGWHNNQTYVNTLSKEAMDEFIRITHETYKKHCNDEFGSTIPAIFTDEPNHDFQDRFAYASHAETAVLPWTYDFAETYEKKYGINLSRHLPELFWELPEEKPSQARYFFHDHACELFTAAFMDNCADWCEKNNIHLTGHVLAEANLDGQTRAVGEAMRTYRSMGIPGIDMLCNDVELTTAKQTQSVVHQYGREAMLSELYGVTNWDFDFRGHKFQGDWQAAFGVTVRVPHLSWVSMKGSAKRDYPASINYQSPWYREYSYIEDHFARLNTVMTRGKSAASVGVIHPIESFWINFGPSDSKSDKLQELEYNFKNITQWLSFGLIDFDFISEAILKDIGSNSKKLLNVGEMTYSTIVVPGCDTMRRTTFNMLKNFQENGGNLIFCGGYPKYIDAEETDEVKALYERSTKAEMNKSSLLSALRDEKFLEIRDAAGNSSDNLIHAVRNDNGILWAFIAHAKLPQCTDLSDSVKIRISFNGEFIPSLYDTVNGTVSEMNFSYENGKTIIYTEICSHDSLLIRLEKGRGETKFPKKINTCRIIERLDFKHSVEYTREEPNVYLLDIAEYKLDDEEFAPEEEVLRIDKKCRQILDFPMANGRDTQPWAIQEEKISHYVTLKYEIYSETNISGVWLAAEDAKAVELNGIQVKTTPDGYYVDKAIKKFKLPGLSAGKNILTVKVPFGKRISVEACYLLGNFNVETAGVYKKITPPSDKIHFGDITRQGLPFYGGNIIYKTKIETPENCSLKITSGRYRGALVKVLIDGKDAGYIVYPPYTLTVSGISKGPHTIEFIVYGNRANTFASMHNYSMNNWYGPDHWYYEDGKGWCYEYLLKETGMLSSPVITMYE